MRRPGVPWVVLSLGWALACGGRYERNAPASEAVGHAGSSSDGASGSGSGTVAGGSSGQSAVAGSAGMMDVACTNQFADYNDYRSQVMAEFFSYGCMIDSDCRSFYDQSACDPACVLLTSAAHRGILDRLNTFELLNCDTNCRPQPWPICPAAPSARCVSGRCQ
jgi:hypothetical protein